MASELVNRAKPIYLDFVFGVLTPEARHAVLSTIGRAEAHLFRLREALSERDGQAWECDGIKVVTYKPPEAFLFGVVESEELGFCVELAPDYRMPDKEWRPWHPPYEVEAWDISGEVHRLDISAPDYDHRSEDGAVLGRLPGKRRESLGSAGDALVEICAELEGIGLSRPADLAVWRAATNR